MNIDVKDIKPILLKALGWLKRYAIIIGIISIAIIYAYIILQINVLNKKEPSQDQVNEKLNTISQPSISEETVNKLKLLEENSTEVKSLFQDARDNPFNE